MLTNLLQRLLVHPTCVQRVRFVFHIHSIQGQTEDNNRGPARVYEHNLSKHAVHNCSLRTFFVYLDR